MGSIEYFWTITLQKPVGVGSWHTSTSSGCLEATPNDTMATIYLAAIRAVTDRNPFMLGADVINFFAAPMRLSER